MVEDDSNIIYVPILKWRKGEKVALKNLNEQLKQVMMPLIELVKDEGDNTHQLSEDIANCWSRTAYVDVCYRPHSFGRAALDNITSHNERVDIIPVIRLDTPPIIMEGIKNVMGMNNNGAAIRLCVNLDQDFEFIQREVDLIMSQLTCQRQKVDLIVDFVALDKPEDYPKVIKKMLAALSFDDWRRVVVSAGAFPADLTEFTPNGENVFDRSEVKLWKQHKNKFPRDTIFSDYTVRGPKYIPRNIPGSKSVRYTIGDQYQVFRGTVDDKPFKYLVHSLNIKTLYGDIYGESYSWGDVFIHEKASQLETCLNSGIDPEEYADFNPGNQGDWVAASVNHHLTVVLRSDLRT